MFAELFIAQRIRLSSIGNERKSSPSLTIALIGIVLAIVVMILSLTIVRGFKSEIQSKVYSLDSHVKITNAAVGLDDNLSTVNINEVRPALIDDENIKSISLIAEQPAILKTDSDFKGVVFKGVDSGFDWSFIEESLIEGKLPDSNNNNEIVISNKIAHQLGLKVGDSIYTYFIDNKVKTRKTKIVGIYNTDFDDFDKSYMVGNITLLQKLNGWDDAIGNYVGVNLKDIDGVNKVSYDIFSKLALNSYERSSSHTIFNVTNTLRNNMTFFSWLSLLDMNVIIIIALMTIVSAFTLISALLMIVLERIKMIGLLKTIGATNSSIRKIFIYLTQKLIVKSIVLGNVIGIGLSLIQKHFHVVKLDPEAYYMPYVPIEFNWVSLLVLNVCIVLISYATLVGPSFIISGIKPTTTMRYE